MPTPPPVPRETAASQSSFPLPEPQPSRVKAAPAEMVLSEIDSDWLEADAGSAVGTVPPAPGIEFSALPPLEIAPPSNIATQTGLPLAPAMSSVVSVSAPVVGDRVEVSALPAEGAPVAAGVASASAIAPSPVATNADVEQLQVVDLPPLAEPTRVLAEHFSTSKGGSTPPVEVSVANDAEGFEGIARLDGREGPGRVVVLVAALVGAAAVGFWAGGRFASGPSLPVAVAPATAYPDTPKPVAITEPPAHVEPAAVVAPAPPAAEPTAPAAHVAASETPVASIKGAAVQDETPKSAAPAADPKKRDVAKALVAASAVDLAERASLLAAKPPALASTRESIAEAVSQAAERAKSCRGAGSPPGLAEVSITFASNGEPAGVGVRGPFAGTVEGQCIATKFRAVRIAPFIGNPMTLRRTVAMK